MNIVRILFGGGGESQETLVVPPGKELQTAGSLSSHYHRDTCEMHKLLFSFCGKHPAICLVKINQIISGFKFLRG